jgi:hypothetical protein
MSLLFLQRKTCNAVRNSQFSSLRPTPRQRRHSSTTREISPHAGATVAGCPATPTAIRPRLIAIASSNGSTADTVAEMRRVAGLNDAGRLRAALLVQAWRKGAAPTAGRASTTWRLARTQVRNSCGCPPALLNWASIPPAVAARVQLPSAIRALE